MAMESIVQPVETFEDKALFTIGIIISLVHIYFNIFGVLPSLTQNAIHYSGFALLCAIFYPFWGSRKKRRNIG
jgi:TRAP-type uncharacterized transport system fused permease subunit